MTQEAIQKGLQIPQELPSCEVKTLMCVISDHTARVFECYERTITELNALSTEDTNYTYSDKEGFSYGPQGKVGTRPGTSHHNKEHYLSVFANYFSEAVLKLYKDGAYEDVIIFIPQNIRKFIESKLPKDMVGNIVFVEGNFAKHHPLDLVKKMTTC